MKKYLEILKKCPLFYGIEDNDLLRMLSCLGAKVECFDKKYTVMSEGNSAKYVGIVLSGSVHIVQNDYYGNRSILSTVEPSEAFCEAFACADINRLPVTVVADEECEIMFIDSEHILHTCSNNCGFHQNLIFNLMKDLAQKVIMLHQKAEVLSKRSTREKLMAYLMSQAKRTGKDSFEIPFDRQELADYLGVERSGLSVEISRLKAEGIIESNKNKFKLL